MDNQRTTRQSDYHNQAFQSTQQQAQSSSQQGGFAGGDLLDSSATSQQQEVQPVSQMSEMEKYGFAGLLATLHGPPEVRSLALGHDLPSLGLDMNSQDPLHPSFSTPFAPNAPIRPLETDYTIPACYSVANVTPLHERINGFNDETLFYIFYSMPRDIMQELVAEELVGRKWRFHKVQKMWLTRDENYTAAQELEPKVSEAGYYVWWDWVNWRKVRRQSVLRYEDLDAMESRMGNVAVTANGAGLGAGMGGGLGNGFGSLPTHGGGSGLMGMSRGL